MRNNDKLTKLLELFNSIREILLKEHENNWIRGISLICNSLTSGRDDGVSADEVIKYVERTYRSMLSGNGSFSDFYIWRTDFESRAIENDRFERIKTEIWSILNTS